MAQAEFHEVLSVDKSNLFAAIRKYEDYPEFVEGCQAAKVEDRKDGKVRVTYQVSVMSREFTYTLDHEEIDAGASGTSKVQWKLVDSDLFKKNDGKWEVRAAGNGKTDVLYALDVEFKIAIPGFILNRLIKGSLPEMVKSFEKRARTNG